MRRSISFDSATEANINERNTYKFLTDISNKHIRGIDGTKAAVDVVRNWLTEIAQTLDLNDDDVAAAAKAIFIKQLNKFYNDRRDIIHALRNIMHILEDQNVDSASESKCIAECVALFGRYHCLHECLCSLVSTEESVLENQDINKLIVQELGWRFFSVLTVKLDKKLKDTIFFPSNNFGEEYYSIENLSEKYQSLKVFFNNQIKIANAFIKILNGLKLPFKIFFDDMIQAHWKESIESAAKDLLLHLIESGIQDKNFNAAEFITSAVNIYQTSQDFLKSLNLIEPNKRILYLVLLQDSVQQSFLDKFYHCAGHRQWHESDSLQQAETLTQRYVDFLLCLSRSSDQRFYYTKNDFLKNIRDSILNKIQDFQREVNKAAGKSHTPRKFFELCALNKQNIVFSWHFLGRIFPNQYKQDVPYHIYLAIQPIQEQQKSFCLKYRDGKQQSAMNNSKEHIVFFEEISMYTSEVKYKITVFEISTLSISEMICDEMMSYLRLPVQNNTNESRLNEVVQNYLNNAVFDSVYKAKCFFHTMTALIPKILSEYPNGFSSSLNLNRHIFNQYKKNKIVKKMIKDVKAVKDIKDIRDIISTLELYSLEENSAGGFKFTDSAVKQIMRLLHYAKALKSGGEINSIFLTEPQHPSLKELWNQLNEIHTQQKLLVSPQTSSRMSLDI